MALEHKIEELEKLVEAMETGGVSLEDGIAMFEKGLDLTKECLAGLNESRGKIMLLKKEMDRLLAQPFGEENGVR